MKLPAPAKLNLCLNILGRRADGYHELQSAFQFLDLCDEIELTPADIIDVETFGLDLSLGDDLACRAARLLAELSGCHLGARIRVTKRIPVGSGLGGGSSNAATVLQGLNRLWQLGLDDDALAAVGLELGADVPVFVRGHSAWAEGIGEKLQAVDFPEKWYVVVHPGVSVSTMRIFAHPDLTRNGTPITIARFLREGAGNACESVVRRDYPAVDEAARWLGNHGPAQMTGTGACLFVPVDTEDEARMIASTVPTHWTAFAARGVNLSPLRAAVDQEIGASPSW